MNIIGERTFILPAVYVTSVFKFVRKRIEGGGAAVVFIPRSLPLSRSFVLSTDEGAYKYGGGGFD
jgi:hypothetical protein